MGADLLIVFGRRVRALRQGTGVSQERLAQMSGMHRTYIGGIERGERNPTLLNIARLAHALGVEPGALLDGSTHDG